MQSKLQYGKKAVLYMFIKIIHFYKYKIIFNKNDNNSKQKINKIKTKNEISSIIIIFQ